MGEENSTYRIADLQESERPRERLERLGAHTLSDQELIAILIRVGKRGQSAIDLGNHLLNEFGGLSGLQRASFADICAVKGIGAAKAAQIKAAIELGSRLSKKVTDDRAVIHSPADAASLIMYDMGGLDHEEMWIILLDTRNQWVETQHAYAGSVNSSQVRVGELFKNAVKRNAPNIILAHNHPSGDPTPSPDDVALTRSAVQAGKLLDIDVLDHLVIARGKFISMKEKGLGF